MNNKAIKSMMNPIRLKIVAEITKRNQMTTKEIQEICSDIPQATLYRHLMDLRNNSIIEVVAENQIRGTIEKVYAMKKNPFNSIQENVKNLTSQQLLDVITQFIISLYSDLDDYVAKSPGLERVDKEVALYSNSLYLSDKEIVELLKEINGLITKRADNEATQDRKLRKISSIVTTSVNP